MSLLSFLSTAQVEPAKGPSGRISTGGGARKPWNPKADLLAIRVWKDGSIFPSQALVDRFNLEYVPVTITRGDERPYSDEEKADFDLKQNQAEDAWVAEQEKLPTDQRKPFVRKTLKPRYKPSKYEAANGVFGNGFDLIDSRIWSGFKGDGAMLFVAPVSKDLAKVDLFGSTKYSGPENEDDKVYNGVPVQSVMDQGSNTFGAEILLPAIKEVYGIELGDNRDYLDMLIVDELDLGEAGGLINIPEKFSQKISHFPKRVLRGNDKGKPDYERRENAKVWGFIPADLLGGVEVETETHQEAKVAE